MSGFVSRSIPQLLLALVMLAALVLPAAAASAALRTMQVKIYLVALGNGTVSRGSIGCGDRLVPVTRQVPETPARLTAALHALLSDHRRSLGQSGLYNTLYQSRLTIQRATIMNGRATVYLRGSIRLNGVCDIPRVEGQLQRTAIQFPTVRSASFFVNGVPLHKRLSQK